MNKFLALSALVLASNAAKTDTDATTYSDLYNIPFDCFSSYTDGVSMTSTTSETFNYGGDVVVKKGYYCYH